MQSMFQRARSTTALMGVASLLCGVVVLLNPTGVALFMTGAIGAVLAVVGVVTILGYARRRASSGGLDLTFGIVETVIGVALVSMPGAFVSWIVVVVGVLILFSGFGDLMEARALSAVGAPFAGAGTVMALLTIAFGVLVVVSPFALVDLAFCIAGAGLVFNGVTELVAALKR